MSIKRPGFIIAVFIFFGWLGYWYVSHESPVYCFSQQRIVPDSEFLLIALKARENEISFYGGIDEYERHFISLNRSPGEAGRNFDIDDPGCCKVFRGASIVKGNCLGGYPVCVRLKYPRYYEPGVPDSTRGRVYLFDACGNVKDYY